MRKIAKKMKGALNIINPPHFQFQHVLLQILHTIVRQIKMFYNLFSISRTIKNYKANENLFANIP